MKTAHDIILKPVITENSMAGIADKKYTFKVATDATKVEIAQAVETLFPGAKVAKVNTISVRGRFRRQGMHAGYTAASKKAIVTLTKDSEGHRANILNPEARKMSVGYYYNSNSTWGHQWIQIFTK